MTGHVTSDQLLDTIAELKAGPSLRRFRVLCVLSREIQVAVETINLEIREQERSLRESDDDIAFIKHHRNKLDACYRAMRGTYAAPDRAMAAFNKFSQDASIDTVREAVSTGPRWLGKMIGGSFLGIHSQERKQGEENYRSAVIPALLNIAPDHGSYLEMVKGNLEFAHTEAQTALAASTAERLALDRAQGEFEREILTAAITMTPEELERLRPEQDEYRAAIALIEQHSSG
jgi:hypothetical protein